MRMTEAQKASADLFDLEPYCRSTKRALAWGQDRSGQGRVAVCMGALLVGALVSQGGCQTAAVRARNLPNEFRAVRSAQTKSIDLSRFSTPGTSETIIAPSDLLEISLSSGRNDEDVAPFAARVAENGTVQIPVVGTVMVGGLDAYQAGHNIELAAIERGMYRHPMVTVNFKSKAVNHITVLGAVNEPGAHELPRGGSDLVSALAAAGGLTDEAGTEVEIIRQPQPGTFLSDASNTTPIDGQTSDGEVQLTAYQSLGKAPPNKTANLPSLGWSAPQKMKIDLSGRTRTSGADFRLKDRDVVRVIPRQQEAIHVDGLVQKPGRFELPIDEDVHLLDAVAMAGGRSSPVADKVYVIRRLEHRPEPLVIQASLYWAKRNGKENLRLMAGDTITVEQTPATAVVDAFSKLFRASIGVTSRTIY